MVEPANRVPLPFRSVDGLWWADRRLREGLHIARDADEWARLAAWSVSGQLPELPMLAVNWQTEMCVVAALGTRPGGGYFVVIDMIEVIGDHIAVRVWEVRPGPNCVTTRGITHPFHVVAAPVHAGEAMLVKRIAYEDCDAVE